MTWLCKAYSRNLITRKNITMMPMAMATSKASKYLALEVLMFSSFALEDFVINVKMLICFSLHFAATHYNRSNLTLSMAKLSKMSAPSKAIPNSLSTRLKSGTPSREQGMVMVVQPSVSKGSPVSFQGAQS